MVQALADADIVVTATSAQHPVITRDQVAAAKHGRAKRPLVFIDIAMPRDVDPNVNELEGVFVHDMSALESIVQKNLERRHREIPRVEAIVAEEVERHVGWEKSLEAGSTIRQLREHFEQLRAEELAAWKGKLEPDEYEKLERLSRGFLNKLLHAPMTRLRRPRPEAGNPVALLAATRELFALDGLDDEEGGRSRRPRTDADECGPGPGDSWNGQ